MMQHYYQTIGENWFSYPRIYKGAVRYFDTGSTFVEVGSWRGRSSVYWGVEVHNSGKGIDIYCVDTWEGSEENAGHKLLVDDGLFKEFIQNTMPLAHIITPVRSSSLEAAKSFDDGSLEFVFIDAAHDYDNVLADIKAWLPKVRQGGVLAGHDYPDWPGVKKAVDEYFGKDKVAKYGSWVHQVGEGNFYSFI